MFHFLSWALMACVDVPKLITVPGRGGCNMLVGLGLAQLLQLRMGNGREGGTQLHTLRMARLNPG